MKLKTMKIVIKKIQIGNTSYPVAYYAILKFKCQKKKKEKIQGVKFGRVKFY